jgi:hypothetical protein
MIEGSPQGVCEIGQTVEMKAAGENDGDDEKPDSGHGRWQEGAQESGGERGGESEDKADGRKVSEGSGEVLFGKGGFASAGKVKHGKERQGQGDSLPHRVHREVPGASDSGRGTSGAVNGPPDSLMVSGMPATRYDTLLQAAAIL